MLKSVEGIYRNGKVELTEQPPDVPNGPVIVTFLSPGGAVDLAEYGISTEQANSLRSRLRPFAEDWERPEMDAYDEL